MKKSKRILALLSLILCISMLMGMGGVYATEEAELKLNFFTEESADAASQSFSELIGNTPVKIAWDTNAQDHNDIIYLTLTNDGSAEPESVEFRVDYAESSVKQYILDEGETVTLDVGPGQRFDIWARYLSEGETGKIEGTISLQPNR